VRVTWNTVANGVPRCVFVCSHAGLHCESIVRKCPFTACISAIVAAKTPSVASTSNYIERLSALSTVEPTKNAFNDDGGGGRGGGVTDVFTYRLWPPEHYATLRPVGLSVYLSGAFPVTTWLKNGALLSYSNYGATTY